MSRSVAVAPSHLTAGGRHSPTSPEGGPRDRLRWRPGVQFVEQTPDHTDHRGLDQQAENRRQLRHCGKHARRQPRCRHLRSWSSHLSDTGLSNRRGGRAVAGRESRHADDRADGTGDGEESASSHPLDREHRLERRPFRPWDRRHCRARVTAVSRSRITEWKWLSAAGLLGAVRGSQGY